MKEVNQPLKSIALIFFLVASMCMACKSTITTSSTADKPTATAPSDTVKKKSLPTATFETKPLPVE